MANYIDTLKLMDNTVAPEASDEAVFDDYCEGASRLFDLLCDTEENFFAPAGQTATEKNFDGNGIDMIRLPPYTGTPAITIDGDVFDPEDYKLRNGYLIYKDDTFDTDSEIVVTTTWGFAAVPAEVRTVTQELANYLWRNRDPMFAKISDVEIEKALSPTTNAIIKKFRDKYSQSAY